MKEEFYNKLSDLNQQQSATIANTWATGHGINQALEEILGDTVHIIHPDLSSIHSPVDLQDHSGVVNYVEAIENCIKEDGGTLNKPIIAIWNTNDIKQKEGKINFNAEGRTHWQTMVILPKNHILQDGSPLNNDEELVFFKDSYYEGRSLPNLMKVLFKNKMTIERDLKEGESADNQYIEIGGKLTEAEIIEQKGKDIMQQAEGYDCGWWAVYNALMFIAEGNDSFLDQFNKAPTRESGYKLRGIFGGENLSLAGIVARQKSQTQNNNLWVGLEEALKASLIEMFKKEEGFEELKEGIKKLDTDYLGMLSFIQSNEGARLEESYRTVMDIIEDYNQGMQLSQVLRTPKKKFILDNKWSDYVESSQLKEKVIREYAGMLKKDVVLDQTYDDFVKFVSSGNIYVDKSLFIKHVLDTGNHLLITCPRRWGKSLNLSMLKAFLQPDGEDETHYKNNKYDFSVGNKHKAFFEGGKIITNDIMGEEKELTPLNIAIKEKTNQKDYLKYQGQYPVIYLNLKGAKESSGEINEKEEGYGYNLDAKLRSAISDAYKEHGYLYRKQLIKKIGLLDQNYDGSIEQISDLEVKLQLVYQNQSINIPDNLKKLKAYYNGDNILEAPLSQSIKFLSDLLREYYGREVFVLVDEFDKPVNDILSRGNFLEKIEEAKKIAKIISDIIAPCSKGISPSTKKIILTGILNSEVQEGSSEINNLYKEGVMTGQLASNFGFNDDEVNWVLDQAFIFKNNYKELLFDQLKYWYNGQIIGQNMEVFTPSSVMRCLLDLKVSSQEAVNKMSKFKPYWTSTETTLILKSFAEISRAKGYSQVLENLIKISYGDEVEYNMDTESSLYSILSNNLEQSANFEQLVFHYLLRSGYITQSTIGNNLYKLPAREVEKIFKTQIQDYWLKEVVFKGTWHEFERLARELDFYNDDVNVIREAIAKLANIAKKGLDTLNESAFEKILFTAFTYSKGASQYKIATQASSGEGFLDVIIYFDNRADIYELKFDSKGTVNNVPTTLESALDQIYQKNYMSTVIHKIKEEGSKIPVKSIKLIPMLLHKMGSEAEYQCQTGEVKEHAIEEAMKISQDKNVNNTSEKNMVKLTLDKLKEKINKSTYNQKKVIVKKLEDSKKGTFTEKGALKALKFKPSAAGYKLVKKFFEKSKAANQSKKKKGITDEFNQKKNHDLTYHSDELDWVLKERMQEESISQKVMHLDTHKSYEYDSTGESIANLLRKVENGFLQNNAAVVIVPYAEEEHFIGLIFKWSKKGVLFIEYMDSENKGLEVKIKEELLKKNVATNEIRVSEQKYNDNCGIETIENFIGYFKGEDLTNRNISQDEAIEIHKVLGESKALNNPFVSEDSIKTLEDTTSMFERLGIEKPKKRTWKEFKEMHGIKDDSPSMMKRMLKKTIPNNKKLDDIFKGLNNM